MPTCTMYTAISIALVTGEFKNDNCREECYRTKWRNNAEWSWYTACLYIRGIYSVHPLSMFSVLLIMNLHHLIIPDDFDGSLLIGPCSISHTHHATEHSLPRETEHCVTFVQYLTNTCPWKTKCQYVTGHDKNTESSVFGWLPWSHDLYRKMLVCVID